MNLKTKTADIGEDFYVTGGTLPVDAPSYVARQADDALYKSLMNGEFCYILTARQMGKSSLMVRTAIRLRKNHCAVVVLDLTALGQNLTPAQWYRGLLERMGRQLNCEEAVENHWNRMVTASPLQHFLSTLEAVILPSNTGHLVFFIDEIDIVRSLPFPTDEFFAAIRSCYNRRAMDPAFSRITFCLLGVAAPADLIDDAHTTPFNIGHRIDLEDFRPEEAALLTKGLTKLGRDGPQLMRRVLYWTSGHPYLTQHMCREIANKPNVDTKADVDRLCEVLFLSQTAREINDNLSFVRNSLLKSTKDPASLLNLYQEVLVKPGKVRPNETDPTVSTLRLSGIVRTARGCLEVRNRIYRRVFDRHWIQSQMPGAEVRRQKVAFRRGILRATTVFVTVITTILLLFIVGAFWLDRTPHIAIPEQVFPSPNAYRNYVAAGDALVAEGELVAPSLNDGFLPADEKYSLNEKKEVIRKNQRALQLLKQGLPFFYREPRGAWSDRTAGVVSHFRYLSYLLVLEGNNYASEGQWNDAVRCYLDDIQFGVKLSYGGSVISTLTGLGIQRRGQIHLWKSVEHLNLPQTKSAARHLEEIQRDQTPFTEVLEEDRWTVLADCKEIFHKRDWRDQILPEQETNGETPWNWDTWKRKAEVRLLSKERVITEVNQHYAGWASFITNPFKDTIGMSNADSLINPGSNLKTPTESRLQPFLFGGTILQTYNMDAASKTGNRFLSTALALRAYRMERGEYPKTLMQLVPRYLNDTPHDPFGSYILGNSQLIGYRRWNKGYLLYSTGPDRVDDGGKPMSPLHKSFGDSIRLHFDASRKGDIVLRSSDRELP